MRSPSLDNPYHGLVTVPYGFDERMLAAELAVLSKKYEFDEELPVG